MEDDIVKMLVLQELLSEPILKPITYKKSWFERLMNKLGYHHKKEVEHLVKEAKVGANQIIEIPRFT